MNVLVHVIIFFSLTRKMFNAASVFPIILWLALHYMITLLFIRMHFNHSSVKRHKREGGAILWISCLCDTHDSCAQKASSDRA